MSIIPAILAACFGTFVLRAWQAFGHAPKCCNPDPHTFVRMPGDALSAVLPYGAHADMVYGLFGLALLSLPIYLATLRVARPAFVRWHFRLGWAAYIALFATYGTWFLD